MDEVGADERKAWPPSSSERTATCPLNRATVHICIYARTRQICQNRAARRRNKHAGASSDNPNRTVSKKAKASGSKVRDKGDDQPAEHAASEGRQARFEGQDRQGRAAGRAHRRERAAGARPARPPLVWQHSTSSAEKELTEFREQMAKAQADPYAVLLKRSKLPMGLLADGNQKRGRVDLLRGESYEAAFGKVAQAAKAARGHAGGGGGGSSTNGGAAAAAAGAEEVEDQGEWSELLAHVAATQTSYDAEGDSNIQREVELKAQESHL